MLAIVDASALIAAADMSEPEHARCVDVLSRRDLYLVLPALAVAEAAYLIERRLGPSAEAAFARGLVGFEIDAPLPVGVTATYRSDGKRDWIFLMNFSNTPAHIEGKTPIELPAYGLTVIRRDRA